MNKLKIRILYRSDRCRFINEPEVWSINNEFNINARIKWLNKLYNRIFSIIYE